MAYTPTTHDALCTCETTQDTQEHTQPSWATTWWVDGEPFTQEEIDAWN